MSRTAQHTAARAQPDVRTRIEALDWIAAAGELDEYGHTVITQLLSADECAVLADLYARDELFRSTVVMARHNFGRGEYRYFRYPLPDMVGALRSSIYHHLAPIANRWNASMGIARRYPGSYEDFIAVCHAAGQKRPTPLLLSYGTGDYNCLHQDLYGEIVFPLQLAIQLYEPGTDFTGGEFVLTEQRPRMQSRVEVVPLCQGDAVLFPVQHRPVKGARGFYRVTMRHGVSRLHSGKRLTAGIILHDAK